MGFHDAEDPSIMSVDSHIPSSTGNLKLGFVKFVLLLILYFCCDIVFTGGSDGHIKFWRLQVDHEAQTLDFHEGIIAFSYSLTILWGV